MFVPLIGLGLHALDFFIFRKSEKLGKSYVIFSFFLISSGIAMDKVINYLNILNWGDQFYPLELLGVWFIFPTYYYHFFEKFTKPSWLPFVSGAVFGPFAYYSGGNLNSTLVLKTDPVSLAVLGIFWGAFF